MRCLSCNREIEGEPECCPGCGAVLDWPDRPVPRPPRGKGGGRRIAAVLAVLAVLALAAAVWLMLKRN